MSRAPAPYGEGDAPDHFREAGNVTAGTGRDNGRLSDRTPQPMYYPDDHPKFPGFFKGMEQVLRERGCFPTDRFLRAQCGTSLLKCAPRQTTCCCRWILYNEEDFRPQKSMLQELYEDAGHLCLYYPKFHCELNFIEQYWGNTKFRYRETPFTNNDDEMIQNMRECLDSVPMEFIRRCIAISKQGHLHADHIL